MFIKTKTKKKTKEGKKKQERKLKSQRVFDLKMNMNDEKKMRMNQ